MSENKKEKPIIFGTRSVRAILEGRKTQARQAIIPQTVTEIKDGEKITRPIEETDAELAEVCAPYRPGDILWVREGMARTPDDEYVYMADEPDWKLWGYKGIPSIHMPRAAARLFLRIKAVRAERLRDITAADCVAEGAATVKELKNLEALGEVKEDCARLRFRELWDGIHVRRRYDGDFVAKKRGANWDANPWVWVYEFERIEKP